MTAQTHQEANQTFYDRISHAYDMIADGGEHKARQAGERVLSVQPSESVLEIGFGTGNSLVYFAEQMGENGKISGIDVSPGMLDVAKTKLEAAGSTHVDLRVGDARELPFEDDSFDAIFSSFTLELFPLDEIPAVIAEAKRVLKPGGRFGIVSMSVVKDDQSPSALEKAYVWMHRHFPHIVDCQPIDVQKLVTDAGMTIAHSEEIEIFTMPVAIVIAKA